MTECNALDRAFLCISVVRKRSILNSACVCVCVRACVYDVKEGSDIANQTYCGFVLCYGPTCFLSLKFTAKTI